LSDLIDGHSTDHTDVTVHSLGDRRRIRELEAQIAKLEERLGLAIGTLTPGLTRKHGECFHSGSFEVSDTDMVVTCKACGERIDPYVVLRKIAHREVNFCYTLASLRAESAQLEKSIKAGRSTLSRLKAQVRAKTPDVGADELGSFMERVGAEAFIVQRLGGAGWASSFRFRDGFRGTRDVYGAKSNGCAVAIRGAMEKAEPTEGTGG
jgi:hypothetical protein